MSKYLIFLLLASCADSALDEQIQANDVAIKQLQNQILKNKIKLKELGFKHE